jgi:hypothetical protein
MRRRGYIIMKRKGDKRKEQKLRTEGQRGRKWMGEERKEGTTRMQNKIVV